MTVSRPLELLHTDLFEPIEREIGLTISYKYILVLMTNTNHIVGISDPGDPQPSRPVNLSQRVPAQMGWRKMEHKGECGLYYLAPGVLVVGVTSVARARERACSFARPRATPPPQEGPGPPFYRYKERVQMYNGGRSYVLTCLAEKCLSPVYMPMWLSEKCLSPVYVITWPSEKCLSPVEA
jgi:hypothetical protein